MFNLHLRDNLFLVEYKVKGDTERYKVTFTDKDEANKFMFDYRYQIRIGLITDMTMRIV